MDGALIGSIVLVLIPALVLFACAWIARARPLRLPRSPGPRFAPVAEGAVLRDALLLNRDRRAFAAVLVDLAVRGRIRLLRPAAEDGGRAPIAVETVERAAFTASEIAVLEALFGRESSSARVRRFSSDSRGLARRVRRVLEGEEQKGIAEGLFVARRRAWPGVLLRILAIGGIAASLLVLSVALFDDLGIDWATLAVAAAGLALVVAVLFIAPGPWRRFAREAEPMRAHLAGMREYIDLAEKEPLRAVQSVTGSAARADVSAQARDEGLERFLLNERMLPYAVLLGMEKSWLKALGEHAAQLRSSAEAVSVGDVLDGAFEVIDVIDAVGGALALVRAVGELADAGGSVADVVGGVFDALS